MVSPRDDDEDQTNYFDAQQRASKSEVAMCNSLLRVSSSFKCYWTGYRSARFSLMSEAIYPMKTALFKIPEKLLR